MVLKTFNVQAEVYAKFSECCRATGLSMSKQIERFMERFIQEEPVARKEYLEKLDRIRKGKFTRVGTIEDFRKLYGLNK